MKSIRVLSVTVAALVGEVGAINVKTDVVIEPVVNRQIEIASRLQPLSHLQRSNICVETKTAQVLFAAPVVRGTHIETAAVVPENQVGLMLGVRRHWELIPLNITPFRLGVRIGVVGFDPCST